MDLEKAAKYIVNAEYVIAFTGAGISAESGIPTFRGRGGLWEKYDPNEYATIKALKKHPEKVWQLYVEIFNLIKKSQPNPAHIALKQLEDLGFLKSIITQNIDDLHERAGSKNVIKIHGNYDVMRCDNCGYKEKIGSIPMDFFPRCPKCGEYMRPDIVLFGEKLPEYELALAFDEASKADLVIVVGTSGVVMPAAIIPYIVRDKGGIIIEVNYEPSAVTNIANISLIGRAGEILPKLVETVKRLI